jgi:hypothetical protein
MDQVVRELNELHRRFDVISTENERFISEKAALEQDVRERDAMLAIVETEVRSLLDRI